MPTILRALRLAALALGLLAPVAQAQAPLQATPIPMWVPNGNVSDVTRVGNTLVVGGAFSQVGPPTGAFAIADAANASSLNAAAAIVGPVTDVVSDGAGGWFVAASTSDGTMAPQVLHVTANGQRDPVFVGPAIAANGLYFSVALEAGRLFVSGSFTTLGGQPRANLAALDPATGAVMPWIANGLAGGTPVRGLFASQGIVYGVRDGGSLATTGVAYDAITGADVAFPGLLAGGPLAAEGDRVYVTETSSSTARLKAYTRAGVAVGSWTSPLFTSVSALAATATQVFALVEPTPAMPASSFLVALDVSTGATVWTSGASTGLLDLAIDGSTIYVGGSFDRVGASARTNIAAIDAGTGALLPWAPLVGGFVTDIAVRGGAVAFGGGFSSVGGIEKRGLVSLDLATRTGVV